MKHTARSILRTLTALGLVVALLLGGAVAALGASTAITKAQAKQIALQHAGVQSSAVKKWIQVKLDNWDDDGDKEWDVEFKTADYRYDVEVNATTGNVEDCEFRPIAKPQAAKKLTEAEARAKALERAGVAEADVVKWTKSKLDGSEWEFKFQTATHTYEVEINAKNGKVKDFEKKKIVKKLTEAEARAKALERAGVAEADVVKWTKSKLDGSEWEFKFQTATHRYEVEINAKTGKVKDFEKKKLKVKADASGYIGLEKAKSIALAHAKGQESVPDSVKFTKAKLDRDDGRAIYEIEFRVNGLEFEYEIDAKTGAILTWDID